MMKTKIKPRECPGMGYAVRCPPYLRIEIMAITKDLQFVKNVKSWLIRINFRVLNYPLLFALSWSDSTG